jgi:hypothetical protein
LETWIGAARQAAPDGDPDRALLCRLSLAFVSMVDSSPSPEAVAAAYGDDFARGCAHPSRVVRPVAYCCTAIAAHLAGDYATMLEQATLATDFGIEGSEMWFGALQMQAWANLRLGDIDEAVRLADQDLEIAYRYGSPAATVHPTLVYAAALQARNEPEAAATVRGWLPPRLTVFLIEELRDLDRWLADRLNESERQTHAARGRALDPRDLQTLTHNLIVSP